MVSNNLTLRMKGEIPFRDLVKTFQGFQKLLDTVAQEIDVDKNIQWTTGQLKGGSAEVTISGLSEKMEDVVKTVEATELIFTRLSLHQSIPYSDKIARQAKMLTHVINGKIQEISVGTGEKEARITERIEVEGPNRKIYAHDSIKGTINTLLRQGRLRFGLYDSLFAKAVTCHASRSQEEEMRQAWGKSVVVSGLVGRDSITGRPVEIKNIREITIVDEMPSSSYEDARGILDLGDADPEVIIRNFRDSEWKFHDAE